METVLGSIINLKVDDQLKDDDQADNLHRYVTVYVLVMSGLTMGVREFAVQPLDCWVTIKGGIEYQRHVNSYCWAKGRLYKYPDPLDHSRMPIMPGDLSQLTLQPSYATTATVATNIKNYTGTSKYNKTALLKRNETRGKDNNTGIKDSDSSSMLKATELNHTFVWITFVIIGQALCFKLPEILWRKCYARSGTRIEQLVEMTKQATRKTNVERIKDLEVVANFLHIWLKYNGMTIDGSGNENQKTINNVAASWCFGYNKKNRFLSTVYLLVKVCYLINVLIQFNIVNNFLNFSIWNYENTSRRIFSRNEEYFPTTALCHFEMKGQQEWVQCVMIMNMLLEKILIVEWLWFLLLIIITTVNLVIWTRRLNRPGSGIYFILRYLTVARGSTDVQLQQGKECKDLCHFVRHYLGQDGVFMFRLLAINTSSVAMTEVLSCLWDRYQTKRKGKGSMLSDGTFNGTGNGSNWLDNGSSLNGKENQAMNVYTTGNDAKQMGGSSTV